MREIEDEIPVEEEPTEEEKRVAREEWQGYWAKRARKSARKAWMWLFVMFALLGVWAYNLHLGAERQREQKVSFLEEYKNDQCVVDCIETFGKIHMFPTKKVPEQEKCLSLCAKIIERCKTPVSLGGI